MFVCIVCRFRSVCIVCSVRGRSLVADDHVPQPGGSISSATLLVPNPSIGVGKRRLSAAQRRARDRRIAKDVASSAHLRQELSQLRALLTTTQEKLSAEKERAGALSVEHFKLSQELRRVLDQADEERRLDNARLAAASATLLADHAVALRRLSNLHRAEAAGAKSKAAAERQRNRLDLERSAGLIKRLRSERDQARTDSRRLHEERNALRKELAELRAEQSQAAVQDVTRVRLSFPGAVAE